MNLISQLQAAAQASKKLAEIIQAAKAATPQSDELSAKLARYDAGQKLDGMVAMAANLQSRVEQVSAGSETVQQSMLDVYVSELVADLRLLVFGTYETMGLWPYDADSRAQYMQVYWDEINGAARSLYTTLKDRAERA